MVSDPIDGTLDFVYRRYIELNGLLLAYDGTIKGRNSNRRKVFRTVYPGKKFSGMVDEFKQPEDARFFALGTKTSLLLNDTYKMPENPETYLNPGFTFSEKPEDFQSEFHDVLCILLHGHETDQGIQLIVIAPRKARRILQGESPCREENQ